MATKKRKTTQLPLEAEAAAAPSPERAARAAGARLHVARLTAKGFAGISDELVIDFDPEVTVLRGENASRKSSVLAALRCVLGIDRMSAGRRAYISGDGTQLKPELEVTLLGEDREVLVGRRGDGSPEVRERVGEDWRVVPRPAEWLRELVDPQGAVPEGFVEAKDEDRATMLLGALELPGYSRGAALEAAGLQAFRLPPLPDGLHPLEDIERLMAAVYDARTEVNRQRDTERDAAAKLLAGLPAEAPLDVAEIIRAGDHEVARMAEDAARKTEAANVGYQLAEEKISGACKVQVVKLQLETEASVSKIRAEAEQRVADLWAGAEKLKLQAEKKRAASLQGLEVIRRDMAEGREKLAALREQQRAADTDRHVRATAQESKAKEDGLRRRSEELTAGLAGLRRYAVDLAGSLPISGLEVRYDEKGHRVVLLDRVPLEQVNTGRLLELADEVSLLYTSTRAEAGAYLPLLLIDWMEQVDETRRAEHLRSLAERGAQVIAAVVAEGPLQTVRGRAGLAGGRRG